MSKVINKPWVLENLCNADSKLIPTRCSKQHLQKLGVYDDIMNFCKDNKSINETLYLIMNEMSD